MFPDKRESAEIDRFMRDTAARWQHVSVELRCVQSMLEEVVAYWRRHSSLTAELSDWLQRASHALQRLNEDERQDFFQVTVGGGEGSLSPPYMKQFSCSSYTDHFYHIFF